MNLLFIPAALTALLAVISLAGAPGRGAIAIASRGAWLTLVVALLIAGWAALAGSPGNGLALALIFLTLFVGAIVLSFSTRYLRADANARRFAATVLLLLAAILTFIVADHAALFAVAWVASGGLLISLIGHVRDWDMARQAMRRTLLRFALGDAALVAALALLAVRGQTVSIDGMILAASAQPDGSTINSAVLLVIAAMVRCSLPPFSSWLSLSMTAPTPVSALMHAGFVNAGGFLLIRFGAVMEAAATAQLLAIGAGAFAAIWGTGVMLVRPDIKRSLAGSTVAQMGFMVMSCGLGAYAAALWHLTAHGLFKAWLFLGSGSAIGMNDRSRSPQIGFTIILSSALLAFAAGILLFAAGVPVPALVPLVLAVATGIATLPRIWTIPMLTVPVAAIIAVYVAGLWLSETILPRPYGDAPGGALLALLLILVFIAVWLGQVWLQRSGRSLPTSLYARLLGE